MNGYPETTGALARRLTGTAFLQALPYVLGPLSGRDRAVSLTDSQVSTSTKSTDRACLAARYSCGRTTEGIRMRPSMI